MYVLDFIINFIKIVFVVVVGMNGFLSLIYGKIIIINVVDNVIECINYFLIVYMLDEF